MLLQEESKEDTPAAKPPSDNLDTNTTSQPPSYNSAVNNDDSVFLSPAASFRQLINTFFPGI